MVELLITVISALVTAVIIPLITVSGQRLIAYINTKINNENELRLTKQAIDMVTDAVKAVTQCYVDELKKSECFNKEAQKEAFNKAKSIVLSQTNKELKDFITKAYGDYDTWLTTQIEVAVSAVKGCNDCKAIEEEPPLLDNYE